MLRKKCPKCGKKVNSKNRFCPNCGFSFRKSNSENWGMLGKNDFEEDAFLEGFTGNLFNKMLGSAMKMLEKEMKREISRENSQPKTNVRLMINGKEIDLKNMNKPEQIQRKKRILDDFSKEGLKKFSELPKKEPKTNVKRLSNIIIYEINMPGVKSIKDISVVKLENSIEIKAVAKDKAYFKLIPVNLSIVDYELDKGKLILELEAKN